MTTSCYLNPHCQDFHNKVSQLHFCTVHENFTLCLVLHAQSTWNIRPAPIFDDDTSPELLSATIKAQVHEYDKECFVWVQTEVVQHQAKTRVHLINTTCQDCN